MILLNRPNWMVGRVVREKEFENTMVLMRI
jgi:hypothetical protein